MRMLTKQALKKQNFILLSIHEIHAERIFAGEKLFELRKVVPKEDFDRVFLYQSGGKGIIGTFEVADVIQSTPKKLWSQVKTKATSQERFFSYFSGRDVGYAIGVRDPIKFHGSIRKQDLEKQFSEFSVPQNFIYVRPGTELHDFLVDQTLNNSKKKSTYPLSRNRNMMPLGV